MSNPIAPPTARPDFPNMEEEILKFWKKNRIFERSIEERPENKAYTFYDGPPFATGLPHHGHLLQSALKDAVPRYWTMQGHRVERVWGWDCHGLPIENLIEKKLDLHSKKEILEYGIDKFNEACRSSVMTYDAEWRKYIHRFGRWVDMDHSYKTMDDSFIESVWWAFAELYKKEWIYKDFRVSLFCPRCSTPLSNSEVTMGHSYRDAEDPAIIIKFKLKEVPDTYLLAWTTTPWTLPANTAIAVHPDLEYETVEISSKGEKWIVAKARKAQVLEDAEIEEGDVKVLETRKGSELVGTEYEPLFSFLEIPEGKKAWVVVDMPYVSAEDGTGLVHTAPAFGEDDFEASKVHGLAVLLTVDDEGKMLPALKPFAGLYIKDADPKVLEDLRDRNLLVSEKRITHAVAECYRCQTLLMYKAQTAWYVNIQKLRSKMLETAEKIHWVPESFKEGRFGKGLENAPDWCISRTRFWGAPIPVWECACGERRVIGSLKELKEALGKDLPEDFDMHRPGIDNIKLPCACGKEFARTEFVFDCWFESGSMPYASVHYPFEHAKTFEERFPADFIGEAQDQTRGWFYNLHVLASGLFGKPAAKHIVATGMILAEDGKKMSKSQKNYTDPYELMEKYGADALRYYLLSAPVMQAESMNFKDEDCLLIQRTVFGTLWNVRQFYLTYAGDRRLEIELPKSMHVLDRWILSRLGKLTEEMTEEMNQYHLDSALRPMRPFVDDLSTWWLRRSRERMKQTEDPDDAVDALRTLREVLLEVARLLAPFTPFFAERLYQDLDGGKMSVHLDKWPKRDPGERNEGLEAEIAWVREAVTNGLDERVKAKIPVRQALASAIITVQKDATWERRANRQDLALLIRDELNVEQVRFEWSETSLENGWKLALDTVLTPELKRKGLIRECVRHLMQLRKKSGFTPQDRMSVVLYAESDELKKELETIKESVATDVKADQIEIATEQLENPEATMKWEESIVSIRIQKSK